MKTIVPQLSPDAGPAAPSPSAGLEHLRLLLENSQDILVEITREGCILYVSPNVSRVLGFEASELIGTSVFDRMHPDDIAETRALLPLAEARATCRYQHRNGAWLWLETTARDFALPDGSRRCVLMARDISRHKQAENALAENQRIFATLLSNLPGMAYRCQNDPEWSMQFVSEGCKELTGYAAWDLIGNRNVSFGKLIVPEDRPQVWSTVQTALAAHRPFDLSYRIQSATGEIKWVQERGQGIYAPQGALLAVEGFITDVTRRRLAEQALAANERSLRAILDQSFQFIGLLDIEGRLLRANQTALDSVGVSPSEVQGRFFWDTPWWSHSETERARLRDAVARAAQGEFIRYETSHPAADGRLLHVDFSLKPIRDEHGHIVALIPEGRDMTDHKEAVQALRESEIKFSKAFRSSPGAMSISDLETHSLVDVNQGYCNLFGFTYDEIVGKSPFELGLWDNIEDRKRFLETFAADGAVHSMEIASRTKSGKRIVCLISAAAIELGGRQCRITALHDITAHRKSEEEKASLEAQLRHAQKLEAVGTLAGGIAHDFNNILAAIMAYTELAVLEADDAANVREHLLQVKDACSRAKDLVRQILTFSRQQQQERKPLRCHFVVNEALKLLRSTIPATIEITTQIDPEAPVVLADPTQIHQVVMNLCTNATHAMRERPGKLTVSLAGCEVSPAMAQASPCLRPGTYTRLTVTDTGHGMDGVTLKRIYDPFFTTKSPGEGTGLGLPVVHGIVKEHEGAILVQSQLHRGTTFEVYLPAFNAAVPEGNVHQPPPPAGQGEHILIVDDEPSLCIALRLALERLGYRVTTQTNPEIALNRFRSNPGQFDLVITDLGMPRMNGVDLARQMLRLRPGQSVLLASGFSGIWTPEKVRSLGIRDLILKPLNMHELGRAVHVALKPATLN